MNPFRKLAAATVLTLSLAPAAFATPTVGTFPGAHPPLLKRPASVIIDKRPKAIPGSILVADEGKRQIFSIHPDGSSDIVAGSGQRPTDSSFGDGGDPKEARFASLEGIAVNPVGELLILDAWAGRLRMVSADGGRIETLAGGGDTGVDAITDVTPGSNVRLFGSSVAVRANGNILVGGSGLLEIDSHDRTVRRLSHSRLGGNGVPVSDEPIPVEQAHLCCITTIEPLADNTVLLSRGHDGPINVLDDNGMIRKQLLPSTLARYGAAAGLATGNAGLLIRSERSKIFLIDNDGNATLFAGRGTGFNGDGLPATDAKIGHGRTIAVDDNGIAYFPEQYHGLVRIVEPDGLESSIAEKSPTLTPQEKESMAEWVDVLESSFPAELEKIIRSLKKSNRSRPLSKWTRQAIEGEFKRISDLEKVIPERYIRHNHPQSFYKDKNLRGSIDYLRTKMNQ